MMQAQGASYPGPLLRAWLVYVEEAQCAAFINNGGCITFQTSEAELTLHQSHIL